MQRRTKLIFHCADIGSVKNGNFGWARLSADDPTAECTTGRDIRDFVDSISADLEAGNRVALGFECPLFVPIPDDPARLTSARPGEGSRPWSAGAGAGALATGLTEVSWILEQVGRKVRNRPAVFVDWPAFQEATEGLFIWEAFVTQDAKSATHCRDAELAVRIFASALPEVDRHNAVVCEGTVRSLFGAALLQTGWATDLAWLGRSCIVLRAKPRA